MKILSINDYSKNNLSPNFRANLWVDKSVGSVIEGNERAFLEAADKYEKWLRVEKNYVPSTLTIRKNTALVPNVAFEHEIKKVSYAYPHEESGYTYTEKVKEYENLEFELDNKKCGFWFDKNSNAEKLFSDFKNVFNFLNNK